MEERIWKLLVDEHGSQIPASRRYQALERSVEMPLQGQLFFSSALRSGVVGDPRSVFSPACCCVLSTMATGSMVEQSSGGVLMKMLPVPLDHERGKTAQALSAPSVPLVRAGGETQEPLEQDYGCKKPGLGGLHEKRGCFTYNKGNSPQRWRSLALMAIIFLRAAITAADLDAPHFFANDS